MLSNPALEQQSPLQAGRWCTSVLGECHGYHFPVLPTLGRFRRSPGAYSPMEKDARLIWLSHSVVRKQLFG